MTTTSAYPATASLGAPSRSGSEGGPGVVLLLGFRAKEAEELTAAADLGAGVLIARNAGEAHEMLAGQEIGVLCLGSDLVGRSAQETLEEVLERHPGHRGCNVVLAAGTELRIFEDLVARDGIYYLTQKPPPRADVVHILQSGVEHYRARRLQAAEPEDEEQAVAAHLVLGWTERVARQAGLEQALAQAADAIRELADADRATVLLYDPATETLWNREPGHDEERRESAAAGLTSFVVRTRTPIRLERVGSDPRYDPEADNGEGPADERFLAVPVVDPATRGRAFGVMVALRAATREPFAAADQDQLGLLARHVAPVLGRFLLQTELEERTARRHGVMGTRAGQVFREEALEHYVQGLRDQGHVLQISPGWTAWAFRLLLFVFLGGLVYSLLGSIHEYGSGPAVVRLEGQTDVTAPLAGTVVAVEVAPGQNVAAGDLLVRLYGVQEAAELDRIRSEFEIGLVNRLRNPADFGTERTLGALRAQKALAERRLDERSVRAPHAGTVGDVWIQPGQHLTPGQVILSLNGDDPRLGIVALLPGHYRPLIRPGMPLRFELQGYSYAYQHLTVESIGEDIVGPAEAQRFLGPGISDAVPLSGPVVYVTARLPSPTFESDGRTYAYHDGIVGTAEVRVRSERILLALIPGLKALWSADV